MQWLTWFCGSYTVIFYWLILYYPPLCAPDYIKKKSSQRQRKLLQFDCDRFDNNYFFSLEYCTYELCTILTRHNLLKCRQSHTYLMLRWFIYFYCLFLMIECEKLTYFIISLRDFFKKLIIIITVTITTFLEYEPKPGK